MKGGLVMNLKEAVKTFGIPAYVMKKMAKEGLIGFPLDETGIQTLAVLSHLWRKNWFAAAVLKGIRARDRIKFLLFPDCNKIDRYILNTILNTPDLSLPEDILRYRVKMAYAADVEIERIRRMKRIAADIRARKKKLMVGKVSLDYADVLGIEAGRND